MKNIPSWLKFTLTISLSLLAGILGSLFTDTGTWYQQLEKPFFTPPSWLFAPVWTLLYILMGIAAGLIWQQGWEKPPVRKALGWFLLQLILNGLWSFSFFGLQSPALGLLNIILLLVALTYTIYLFWGLHRMAAYLLIPYLLWVGYATALNAAIFFLN